MNKAVKFEALDIKISEDFDGNFIFSAKVSPKHKWFLKEARNRLSGRLSVKLEPMRNARSLEQNRMLWALLEIMAEGLRRQGILTDAWDCYIDALERASAKFVYMEVLKEAVSDLKQLYRAVKVVEERKGGKTVMVKAFAGSSTFDTKEMTGLIDTVFLMLDEYGIETPETRFEYEMFYAGKEMKIC